MSGRHRKPTNTALRLARVGALTVMAASPLVFTGSAMASPLSDDDDSTGSMYAVDDGYASTWSDDDDDDYSSSSASRRHSYDDDDAVSTYRNHDNVRSKAREASASKRSEASATKRRASASAASERRSATAKRREATSAAYSSSSSRTQDAKWDRLAKCESTQNWDANTGNGYRGGLQFTDSTWRSYGGQKYARSADQASREEQIAVAKKVQSEQGWNAWPSCSKKLGYA
ncbi:transglycosylase family protein [Pseudonocardia spinosispora]|uniref:transglycosylase family protein n=1 Tax=Pseudonocardia spinosispora TaxID=103441 RepID=UPI00041A7399|nr:transglycosylase family protein [Pseudonocardia spinosispora]